MASGDVIVSASAAYLLKDHADVGKGTTVLHSGVFDITVEHSRSGLNETLFDAAKNYNIVITEV